MRCGGRQVGRGGCCTQKLAKAALCDELRQRESSVYVAAMDLTLRQFLEGYTDDKGKEHEGWLDWGYSSGRSDPSARRRTRSTATRRASTSSRSLATWRSRS